MSLTPVDVPAAAGQLLDTEIIRATAIAGGSLSNVYRLTLADTREVIAKGGPGPQAEADMLRAIRRSGASAPAVIAADESCLIIEALPAEGRITDAWADLGKQLAMLHAVTNTHCGWHTDYAFGEVIISNTSTADWPTFWAECRLLPHLQHLDAALAKRIESLAADIDRHLPAEPQLSLLHGDLWGGNVLVDGNRVTGLIDPACYFGDPEVDLAMLGLFDHPGEHFFSAYGSLAIGFEKRLAIYALWPALVHVRLFGSGYVSMADRFLKTAGY
jgi:fructosamine-3-kinase